MTGDTDDTETAWREIVANYGDRAVVPPEEYAEGATYDLGDAGSGAPDHDVAEGFREDVEEDEDELDRLDDEEDGFVPPPAPPLPATRPERVLAWLGALGAPAAVVVLLLTGISVPVWLGWALIGAFVGGFGYLVATMPREPRDPWDDGARV